MKAVEFIMLYKVGLTFESVGATAVEQYFLVVLFIMLYKVGLTFESGDEILKCDHSKESYRAIPSCGAVYYAVQGGSTIFPTRIVPLRIMPSLLSSDFPCPHPP